MYTQTDERIHRYQERIEHILKYIEEHMGEPLSCVKLSSEAGFSVPHFHRIFKAFVGESLAAYVRRLRLENAVSQIVDEGKSITDAALENGYETPAAFAKAFKKYFGVNPSTIQNGDVDSAMRLVMQAKPIVNQVQRSQAMVPEIRVRPDRKVAYIRDVDDFEGIYRAWDKISTFMNSAGDIITDDWETLGIIHDPPDATATSEQLRTDMRYDACVGIQKTEGAAEKATTFEDVEVRTLAGGKYAVFLHQGVLDKLPQAWDMIYKEWLPSSDEHLRDVPPFEMYLDSPETPAEERKTEIYIPIE